MQNRLKIGSIYRWNIPSLEEKPIVEILAFGKVYGQKGRYYLATLGTGGVTFFGEKDPPGPANLHELVYLPPNDPPLDDLAPSLVAFVDPPIVGRRYESEKYKTFVIRAIGSCLYTGNGYDHVFVTFEPDGEIYYFGLEAWDKMRLNE